MYRRLASGECACLKSFCNFARFAFRCCFLHYHAASLQFYDADCIEGLLELGV